jgi:hypothetical protein
MGSLFGGREAQVYTRPPYRRCPGSPTDLPRPSPGSARHSGVTHAWEEPKWLLTDQEFDEIRAGVKSGLRGPVLSTSGCAWSRSGRARLSVWSYAPAARTPASGFRFAAGNRVLIATPFPFSLLEVAPDVDR